jgi:Tol biopolymer transport system component
MTGDSRIERALPRILEDLGAGVTPDYVDSLLGRTAATRQRPGWTFIERWIPVSALTERMATAPRVPLRAIALVALLIIALAATAIYVGSQQRRLPAPFGPAGNGVIPYVSGGDVYVGDLATGATRLLVGGPDVDVAPQFSPDGTKVAFARSSGVGLGPFDIYVVRDDGSGLKRITTSASDIVDYAWTPDGRRLWVIHAVDSVNQLDLFDASGNASAERIAAAAGLDSLRFRPPDGREMLFRALVNGKYGLFAMNADGTNVRSLSKPLVPANLDMSFRNATYSADGSRIFFQHAVEDPSGAPKECCQLYVMNADGSDPHPFIANSGQAWDGEAAVSPDGTRIAFWHNPNDGPAHGVAVMRADGTGRMIDTGPPLSGTAHWVWAPDSSKILMFQDYGTTGQAFLLDPGGGPWTLVPWGSNGDLDWQRVATK